MASDDYTPPLREWATATGRCRNSIQSATAAQREAKDFYRGERAKAGAQRKRERSFGRWKQSARLRITMLVASSVLVVVFVAGVVLGRFFFFADFFPSLIQGFLGKERVRDAGVVLKLVEENLVDLDAIAFAGDLIRGLDAIDGVIVRVVLDFLGAHASVGVARVHDFAHGQVRGACDGDAERAIVAIDQLDPVGFLVVHHVQTGVTENHPLLMDAMAEYIVDVLLGVFLKRGEICDGGFRDAAAVRLPAFIAVVNRDDLPLG